MSTYGISFKNKEQQELIRLIRENGHEIIFCVGSAGTGKTFASIAAALDLKQSKKYAHIIYARNPIQLGEDMGFLPGGIEDKYNPFMRPLYSNIENIAQLSSFKPSVSNMKTQVEIVPIAFLRGDTFNNSVVIVDEAQNLDYKTLQAIITRLGQYSKLILLGSMDQIDDPKQARKDKCDFEVIMNAMAEQFDFVGKVELVESMRNPQTVNIDKFLSELYKKNLK